MHHLSNAIHEATRAEKLLSSATGLTIPVTTVIGLVGVRQLTVRRPPIGDGDDIAVFVDRNLLLLSGRPMFSAEKMQGIVGAAVRPGRWSIIVSREPGVAELIAAYEAAEAMLSALRTGGQCAETAGFCILRLWFYSPWRGGGLRLQASQ